MNWTKIPGVGKFRQSGGTVYVWVAGSNDAEDWRGNLNPAPIDLEDGAKVGWRDNQEASLILSRIVEEIGVKSIGAVTICGFSRGGAIAQILAYDMADIADTALLLFASKRAGNRRFCQLLRDKKRLKVISAVKHRGDLIPFLPPWPLYRNVKHSLAGKLTWPWTAHMRSAKAAARLRDDMDKALNVHTKTDSTT